MNTSLVTIVEQGDILRESAQKFNLMDRQGRSGIGHHVLQTTLMHGDDIGITFHHIYTVLLSDGFLGLIETIELTLLVVDLRVGRVHIFLLHALGP